LQGSRGQEGEEKNPPLREGGGKIKIPATEDHERSAIQHQKLQRKRGKEALLSWEGEGGVLGGDNAAVRSREQIGGRKSYTSRGRKGERQLLLRLPEGGPLAEGENPFNWENRFWGKNAFWIREIRKGRKGRGAKGCKRGRRPVQQGRRDPVSK